MENWLTSQIERSVLVMLSDRSSAPTLLGCRPSARNSLGRSQKRFQLLTKIIFCSVHHENNHSFKASSLLNFSCPRRYVGRGPDTMIVAAGDVLRTVSTRLLKSLFSGSVVSRRRSEGHLWRSRPGCTGPVKRNTRSRGSGSVSSALHTYPGLMSVSPRCFQRCFPFPQLGLFPKQLVDPSLHGLQLKLHRMQLERVLTCTQR